MAHYAFLDTNSVVVEVISGIDETETIDGLSTELWYAMFRLLDCKRTSYSGAIRGKYAGIGDKYEPFLDLFISPSPFPSWKLNELGQWIPPKLYPSDGNIYNWDEVDLCWVPFDGIN